MEPQGSAQLNDDTYEKPEDWGEIHQWEALSSGFSSTESSRWWAISRYYPDSAAAEADSAEMIDRMNGYRTAITPLMYPNMSNVGLAAAAEHPYVINELCTSLTPVYTSDQTGSILTVWCQMSQPYGNRWQTMMEMRDLGFLLP